MSGQERNDISILLQQAGSDGKVTEELLPLVYEELRRMAANQMAGETPGQTLQPTALVHEAYVRLVGGDDLKWESRAHFFGAAARSMRQILINRAKKKKADKHGGQYVRREFDDRFLEHEPEPDRMLALDVALEKLEAIDPRKSQIVMLRYFAGLSIEDTARATGVSPATIKRDWLFARAWLQQEMTNSDS